MRKNKIKQKKLVIQHNEIKIGSNQTGNQYTHRRRSRQTRHTPKHCKMPFKFELRSINITTENQD